MPNFETQLTDGPIGTAGAEHGNNLVSNAPCGILSCAPDSTIISASNTFLQWTGFSPKSLVGLQKFQDLLNASDRHFYEADYHPKLMQGSQSSVWTCQVVCMDGTSFTALIASNVKRIASGDPPKYALPCCAWTRLLLKTTIG